MKRRHGYRWPKQSGKRLYPRWGPRSPTTVLLEDFHGIKRVLEDHGYGGTKFDCPQCGTSNKVPKKQTSERQRLKIEREWAKLERQVETEVAKLTAHRPAEVRYVAVAPLAVFKGLEAQQLRKIPVAVKCLQKRGYYLHGEEQGVGTMRTLVFRKQP